MTRDEALRKVAALLRLGNRPGTAGEANAAVAAAQALMDKYEIERESVNLEQGPSAEADEPLADFSEKPEGDLGVGEGSRPERWRINLAGNIARANACFTFLSWRGSRRTLETVGRPSAVEVVRYLNAWLVSEVSRIRDLHGAGMGRVWRREFCEGAVDELSNRLREKHAATVQEIRAEHASNPLALMRINQAIERIAERHQEAKDYAWSKHGLRSGSGGGRRQYDLSARQAGAAAAKGISMGGGRRRIGGAS